MAFTNPQGLTPEEMNKIGNQTPPQDTIDVSTTKPGALITGATTGQTPTNGMIAPTDKTFQAFTTPTSTTEPSQAVKDAASVSENAGTLTSAPAKSYLDGLREEAQQKEAQLQQYATQSTGGTITAASKNAYISQLPPPDANESTTEKELRNIVEHGGFGGVSAGNAITAYNKAREERIKIEKERAKLTQQQGEETATANVAAFRAGQAGGSYAKAAADKLAAKQKDQMDTFGQQAGKIMNAAWDSALQGNFSAAEQFRSEANRTFEQRMQIEQLAQQEKEQTMKLQEFEDNRALKAQDRAMNTIGNLVKAGFTVDQVPESYLDTMDEQAGMPKGFSKNLFDISQSEKDAATVQNVEEQKAKKIANASKLVDTLNKIPLGQSIEIDGVEYQGLDRGDIKTGTETDANGNVTFYSYDQNTGKVQTTSLGAIGKSIDGWDTKFDDNGNPWRFNAKTGQMVPFYPSESQKEVQQVLPDGSVSPFKDENGNPRTQCGAWVNDCTGLGVGDSFESKMEKMNLWKKGEGDPESIAESLQIGDVFVQKLGTWTGHTGMILGVERGPNGEIGVRANESNYPQKGKITSSRFIPLSQIDGFGRGPKTPPFMQTGPDAKGPTFGSKKTVENQPAAVQEYEYAKNQGYEGTFEDWKKKSTGATGRSLESGQVKLISEGKQTALVLDPLEKIINENANLFGPIAGRTIAQNPYGKAAGLQDDFRRATQVVGSFMEGGVLRKEDEEKYAKMLPSFTDTPDVARNKLKGVREMLEAKRQQYIQDAKAAGYDVSQFETINEGTQLFSSTAQPKSALSDLRNKYGY